MRLAALVLLMLCAHVHAYSACATNSAELQQALSDASDGGIYANEYNSISIAAGTYATGTATNNGPFTYTSTGTNTIAIFGGYDSACFAGPSAATPTVLDGQHATPVLAMRSTHGTIQLLALTLQNGESTTPGAGLQINYQVTGNGSVQIYSSIIRNNHSSAYAGGLYAINATGMFGTLISGNSADGDYGGAYMISDGAGPILLYKITVAKNVSALATNPIGGLVCGGSVQCHIADSIFWNNTNIGLFLADTGADLSYNDYGSRGGTAPANEDHRLSMDPQFIAPASGNFRLQASSPLLGFGRSLGGQLADADFLSIPKAGYVDLGSYEETIFGDGYDG